jgi:hypothetical protein
MRQKDYPKPPELTEWGFPASHYNQFTLTLVPSHQDKAPPSPDAATAARRFEAAYPGYLEEHCDTTQKWEDIARYIPFDMLATVFTFEELHRQQWKDCIISGISEEFDKNPALMLFRKIGSSIWKWGGRESWESPRRRLPRPPQIQLRRARL